jgi:hypothetical protein
MLNVAKKIRSAKAIFIIVSSFVCPKRTTQRSPSCSWMAQNKPLHVTLKKETSAKKKAARNMRTAFPGSKSNNDGKYPACPG